MNSIEEWALRPNGLVARLRELRERAGLTGSALAGRLGWQQPRVSKIENGKQLPSVEDIDAWITATGGTDKDRGDLHALRVESLTVTRQWRSHVRGGQVTIQQDYDALVRNAKIIRNAEVTTIPGLLQTPGYARSQALQAINLHDADSDELDRIVEAKMHRQSVLYDAAKRFQFVITEAALRLLYCPREEMLAQLDRLMTVTFNRSNFWFGIIPFAVRLDTVPENRFLILDDVAINEHHAGEHTYREDQASTYAKVMDRLVAEAVVEDAARELIVKAMRELGRS